MIIKLTQTSRRILRAIFRGISVAAVSLSLSACPWIFIDYPVMYGPGPDIPNDDIYIQGKVVSGTTGEPVAGIGIWIKDVTVYYTQITMLNGNFSFWLPKKDNYTIVFTDMNGEEGGLFKQREINLTREEVLNLRNTTYIKTD